jgi:hypothetical protein
LSRNQKSSSLHDVPKFYTGRQEDEFSGGIGGIVHVRVFCPEKLRIPSATIEASGLGTCFVPFRDLNFAECVVLSPLWFAGGKPISAELFSFKNRFEHLCGSKVVR